MKKKSIILRVLAFGVCVYMIVTIAGLWRDLAKAQEEKNTLLAEKDQLTNEIDELKEILADDSHTALIERVARSRLGYVYPDEQIFIDTPGS